MRRLLKPGLKAVFQVLFILLLLPAIAHAQGSISGQLKDSSGGALPGVTVEIRSPQLIERVRTTTTDNDGRYQIINLPVGAYEVTFKLESFATQVRGGVIVSSETNQTVNGELTVGNVKDVVTVVGEPPTVDVANARQIIYFQGSDIRELPTARNVPDMLLLIPGVMSSRGICSGGLGTNCSPNLTDFNSHASLADTTGLFGANAGLNQGRILVDGMIINSASPNSSTGMSGGYVADVTNAQEVSFNLSGALGESETGGASINVVPRTGGNRFAGNYFTAYANDSFFSENNGTRTNITINNPLVSDYDVNGAYGGPIVKDRLWFFANARTQGKEAIPSPGNPFYPNKNLGIFGKNYQPDRAEDTVTYKNKYRNVSLRLTVQPSVKHKVNIFWDEQDSCQDPCYGTFTVFNSPESGRSLETRPNHLGQLSWSSPFTNRILLEAGMSATMQHFDTTSSREFADPTNVPRLIETGDTAGADSFATRVNQIAGTSALTSGSLNSPIGAAATTNPSEVRNLDSYRSRASVSYITGSHNAKFGYDGGYFMESVRNKPNDLRLTYNYATPATNCATNNTCGNTSLYFPEDPNNTIARRPVPVSFDINTGEGTLNERVWYGALYIQDQVTWKRFTLSGALRYDHAGSRYGETCVGEGGNEPYVPIQIGGKYDGLNYYCTEPSAGVSYNDITPRWAAAIDVFGNGKTSVKWNMGKYLAGASIGGQYNNNNPARRSVQTLNRGWQDTNGNRRVDCRIFDFNAHTDLGDTCNAVAGNNANRYGRDPYALDAAGLNASLFTTLNCGAENPNPTLVEYCNRSGDDLVHGWGARTYTWLMGLGVQHELLPRLSAEVTYNMRYYGNQPQTDVLGRGCDRFEIAGAMPERECQEGYLNFTSNQYDFYKVVAPRDIHFPEGGGYVIRGLNNQHNTGALPDNGTVIAFDNDRSYRWDGIDTNFVMRARGGLRISGGTSTGSARTDRCFSTLDGPDSKGRVGNEYKGSCLPTRPFQTNMRANASYTIPWMDVLVSTVFQYRPGTERTANLTYNSNEVIWEDYAAARATAPCVINNVATVGCFNGTTATNTTSVSLMDVGELYGEGIRLFDLKLGKNIRFGKTRINLGLDVYNLFNSDAIISYNNTYTAYRAADGSWIQGDNPATPAVEVQNWGQPTGLIAPRFFRLQFQVDF